MEHIVEQINSFIINISSVRNQLMFMKKIMSISSNPEILSETVRELQRLRRSFETTSLGSSLFPFGIQYVYVWELEEGKYYVGWSENLSRRLDEHISEEGSVWTKQYKPIGIVEIVRGDKHVEKTKTLEYIKKKGFANVRGSTWCHVEYRTVPLEVQKYLAKES